MSEKRQMWTVLLGCLGLLVSIRGEAETQRCPQGWMTSAGTCYRIFQERRPWREAERDCHSPGARGHLASILDAEETKDVAVHITSSPIKDLGPVWIGMFYKGKGDWWWIDAYKILYSNWIKGSPNVPENGRYCVYLEENEYKYWKEMDCDRPLAYLCKYELQYQRRGSFSELLKPRRSQKPQ